MCCRAWSGKELDTTERLNNNNIQNIKGPFSVLSLHPIHPSPSLILLLIWLALLLLFYFPNQAAHIFQVTFSKMLISLCSQTK